MPDQGNNFWEDLSAEQGYYTTGSTYHKCNLSKNMYLCGDQFPDQGPNPQPWEPDFPWVEDQTPHQNENTRVIPWKPQYEDPHYDISIHEEDGSGLQVPLWVIIGLGLLVVIK